MPRSSCRPNGTRSPPVLRVSFSRSIKGRRVRAAILFDHAGRSSRRGSGNSRSSSRSPVGWSMTRRRSGRRSRRVAQEVLRKAGVTAGDVAAIGITNQRETTVIWDRGDRQADRQRDRLAGPAHGGALRRAEGARAGERASARRPALSSTPTSPARKSAGCSTTSPARGSGPSAANSPSARLIPA